MANNSSQYLVLMTINVLLGLLFITRIGEGRNIGHPHRHRDVNSLLGMIMRRDQECKLEGSRVESADPCETCQCIGGRVNCQKKRCSFAVKDCVDALPQPENCCSNFVCPNGPNCYHNEDIINGHELHQEFNPDTGCVMMCSCPPSWRVNYDKHTQAECTEHCPRD